MNQAILIPISQIVVLLFLIIIHEVSHGLMAYKLGDSTAKEMGTLTLNPIKHLEFFGSFLVPLIFMVSGSPFILGWAKPVPFNPYNLKNPKKDGALIAAAGPLSNFILAALFGVIARLILPLAVASPDSVFWGMLFILNIAVFMSILLGIFNLIPIPPFDGSRIVFAFLPERFAQFWLSIERYGTLLIILLLFGGLMNIVYPAILFAYRFLIGPAAIF